MFAYTGEPPSEEKESENPDLEDGEIEDDDEDDEPQPTEVASHPQENDVATSSQILPAAIPTDTNIFPHNDAAASHIKTKRRPSSDRKSDKHLTEAEKCVRMLHKLERAERERRERLRREQMTDWAGNVEKAIASVLKKDRHSVSGEEEEEEEKKRGRKRKKKERERKKKHRKVDSPKTEEIDDDEMLNVRGGSPENKPHKENSPVTVNNAEAEAYESYESAEYDSDYHQNNSRPNKRNFDRERKARNRNRESRRERKNFREKNRKKDNDQQQQRPPMQDANSICMFFMQGKCHKQGDECPYSHDALPPMKMELCKFYLMECCAKRDKCLYMHSEFPCKYYHTGLKCFAKDNCKFAHGKPLSDSLKQILLKHLETAPKEILGDFPRLSREGAQHMVNQTQKGLEIQYGIKTAQPNGSQSEKSGIPSLFDITVPVPAEIQIMQHQQQMQQQQQQQQQNLQHQNAANEDKSKQSEKSDKPTKVRHTRWNDEPAVAAPVLSLLNPAFAGTMSGNPFSSLNPQDQQKIQEYQLNYQLKGFYSEQDQDMRINSNGDVDMRALPQIIPQPTEPAEINYEQYKHDAGLTSNMSEPNEQIMDTDIRNFGAEPKPAEIEEPQLVIADKTEFSPAKKEDVTSDSSANMENLTIDEKAGDSGSELPSNLPKKQRELFLRIQAQQKENIPENQHANDDSPILKDDDWYSSDDDNDPLSKMVIHLEDEPKDDEDGSQQSPSDNHTSSPPPIKPVEVIDKLGDLSKIDISAEVTKLLTSIKSGQAPISIKQDPATYETSISSTTLPTATISDVLKRRDPRQAIGKTVDMEIKSPIMSTDRVKSCKGEPRDARLSIYEQGIVNPEEAKQLSIYDQGMIDDAAKEDVDLRNLDALAKDLDMRPSFGDTDLRQGGAGAVGRKDVDLRQLGLQFKAMQNYTPATEIDASHNSHPNIVWKLYIVDIPRPDYSGLKLQAQDAQVIVDPRLRKIFRVQSSDEKDSPASPKQQQQQQPQQPQKPARQDPRRRNVAKDESPPKSDVTNLSYSQQLQLLQNSAFYQSLTSSQKVMLNQEIALKCEQNTLNDPILGGILSSLGLIQSLNNQNGSAMNILANVNSLVPNLNPGLMPQNMGNMGQNMNQNIGQNMGGLGPNMGVGMGGNMGQNMNAMGSNLGQMPQNMGQMGPNLGPMGQNMGPNMVANMGQPMGPNLGPNMAGPGLNPALGQNLGGMNPNMGQGMMPMNPNVPNSNMGNIGPGLLGAAPGIPIGPQMGQNEFQINFDPRNGGLLGPAPFQNFPENQNFQYNEEFYPNNNDDNNFNNSGNQNYNNNARNNDRNFRGDRNAGGGRRGRSWNNRNNNARNFNRNNNNNRNRSNRSYTPP